MCFGSERGCGSSEASNEVVVELLIYFGGCELRSFKWSC